MENKSSKIDFISSLSKEEIIARLYPLCFWDSAEDIRPYKLFLETGNADILSVDERINLYYRLLKGLNWHSIVKILPKEYIEEALADNVLIKLFPKSLSTKYRYVRSILFE
jgi:hypothetical protein